MALEAGRWQYLLRQRLRLLVRPYAVGFGVYLASFAAVTALVQPWALGNAWVGGATLVGGLWLCCWLWPRWRILAATPKGDARFTPLVFLLVLCVCASWSLRQLLRARLGEVRTVHSVRELDQPGAAIFFRLRGPFYVDKYHRGIYTSTDMVREKSGVKSYSATCTFACPLLAAPADTLTPALQVPTWLGYTYHEALGQDLSAADEQWLSANFLLRTEVRFDTLQLADFTYLERIDDPSAELYQAVQAGRLSAGPAETGPLLLAPVKAPFGRRGWRWAGVALSFVLGGSALIVGLLLMLELRPSADWPPPAE